MDVVRLLGGVGYWPYGVEQLNTLCRQNGIHLAILPGDDQPDPELTETSTLPLQAHHRLWQYFVQGGPANAENFLSYAASLLGEISDWREPVPLVRAGLYWPDKAEPTLDHVRSYWQAQGPIAPIVFYRALLQSDDLKPIDALISALLARGVNPLPIFVSSLKDSFSAAIIAQVFAETHPA